MQFTTLPAAATYDLWTLHAGTQGIIAYFKDGYLKSGQALMSSAL